MLAFLLYKLARLAVPLLLPLLGIFLLLQDSFPSIIIRSFLFSFLNREDALQLNF